MKKTVMAVLLCVAMFFLTSCNSDFNTVYSDNAQIVKSDDKYASINSVSKRFGNEFSFSGTMTGSQTIWSYNAKSDSEVDVSCQLSVLSGGKAKLVLITPEKEVVILCENTDRSIVDVFKSSTIHLKKGRNRIKLVGYDSPEIRLEFSAQTPVELM